jgi:hypothetical protein
MGEMMRENSMRKARDKACIDCRISPIIHTAERISQGGPDNTPIRGINN